MDNKLSASFARDAYNARQRRNAEARVAKGGYKVSADGDLSESLGEFAERDEAQVVFDNAKASGQYKSVNLLNPAGLVVDSYYNNFYKR